MDQFWPKLEDDIMQTVFNYCDVIGWNNA